jgi:hypothetical protein
MKTGQIIIFSIFLLIVLTSCSKESTKYVCANGQTVSDPSLCPQPTPEPEKTAYYCDDGRQVDNPILCSQKTLEKNEISITHLSIGPGPCLNIEKITNDTYVSSCNISRKMNYLAFTFTVQNTGNTLLKDVFCVPTCEQYVGEIIQQSWSSIAGPTDSCIPDNPSIAYATKIIIMKTKEWCGGEYTIMFNNFPQEIKIGRYICNLTCYSNITPTRDSKEIIFTAKFVD